jgi:hypothetical protein
MDTKNASPPPPPPPPLPASRKYAHLYMPLITILLLMSNSGRVTNLTNPNKDHPIYPMILTMFSAIPTYLASSTLYPANPPRPTPAQAIRFTRKHDAYRALVLAAYGRLYGTPFNMRFLIADFMLSYAVGEAIGERPAGTPQRRSEFLVALVWVLASFMLETFVPVFMVLFGVPGLEDVVYWLVIADRTIWRAAWLALVDDVVGSLVWPDVRRFRGRVGVVVAQSVMITGIVFIVLLFVRRTIEGEELEMEMAMGGVVG